jgi:hypothetical protein
MNLVRYEQARAALAECHRVDEVKDIRDKAEAMAAYARQAKDQDLILWATEIKIRAERKAGEMIAALPRGGKFLGRDADGDFRKTDDAKLEVLAEMGVSKDQSSRWQGLAAMSEESFETAVATARDTAGQVTTAFMLREAAKGKPAKPPQGKKAEALRQELKAAQERGVSMLAMYARLTIKTIESQDSVTDEEMSLLAELADVIAAVRQKERNRED